VSPLSAHRAAGGYRGILGRRAWRLCNLPPRLAKQAHALRGRAAAHFRLVFVPGMAALRPRPGGALDRGHPLLPDRLALLSFPGLVGGPAAGTVLPSPAGAGRPGSAVAVRSVTGGVRRRLRGRLGGAAAGPRLRGPTAGAGRQPTANLQRPAVPNRGGPLP